MSSSRSVRVDPRGHWFKIDGELRVVLGPRRKMLRRLLSTLATNAEPVAAPKLIEAVWPDERLPMHTAFNRLHVALYTLRRLGLGELIETVQDGYVLAAVIDRRNPEDHGAPTPARW